MWKEQRQIQEIGEARGMGHGMFSFLIMAHLWEENKWQTSVKGCKAKGLKACGLKPIVSIGHQPDNIATKGGTHYR